jgi:hypothetical protein
MYGEIGTLKLKNIYRKHNTALYLKEKTVKNRSARVQTCSQKIITKCL